MKIEGYRQFGGKHCETGSLKNVLAHHGVEAPHSHAPFSEEMLLGIGGGIGFSYWVFQAGVGPSFFAGTRHADPKAEFLAQVCARLGLRVAVRETSSPKRGKEDLLSALASGHPAIARGDMAALPYMGVPPDAHFGGHTFVIYGTDEATDRIFIADRPNRPVTVHAAELAAARASRHKPFPPDHKLFLVEPPRVPIRLEMLRRAILKGISDCCLHMLKPPLQNLGLKGLLKWADLVRNSGDPKGWPQVFAPGPPLYGALLATFLSIEISGTGGGAFRSMYAAFLAEAAAVLDDPSLELVSGQFRQVAGLWSELAAAALPEEVALFRETRGLVAERNCVFERQEPGAAERMRQINRRLEQIQAEIKSAFPLEPAAVSGLLEDLSARIRAIHAAEQDALAPFTECASL
ncbi:MAG TPA: BtrH N-terminal domain-containing protein [Bryobacteraceae bacterium]|nr:BtrH N-terminal domain-containing protein [Bryobacteraceae bacterium]